MANADNLTVDILVVGACAVGTSFIGGSIAGVAGAFAGTLIGLVLGVVVARRRRI